MFAVIVGGLDEFIEDLSSFFFAGLRITTTELLQVFFTRFDQMTHAGSPVFETGLCVKSAFSVVTFSNDAAILFR